MNDSYDDPYGGSYGNSQGSNPYHDSNSYRQVPSGSLALATAAFILCLIGGASFYIFYISIPLAALAIILALLSRGDGKPRARAKIAIIIGVIDIVISSAFTVTAVYSVLNDPTLRAQLETMWDYYMDYFGGDLENDPIGDFLDRYGRDPEYEDLLPGDDSNPGIQSQDGQEFVFLDPDPEKLFQAWQMKGGISA